MRLYRLLLHTYPASFRHEYGEEMCRLFAERRRRASRAERLALWAEAIRDAAGTAPSVHLDLLRQDLRHARRSLNASRGFAVAAILVMAIGIGATTAVFSITDRVLLRPLPFQDPDRLVQVWERIPGYTMNDPSPANFNDWRARTKVFDGMAATALVPMNMVHREPERVIGVAVTANLFPLLGVQPALGRNFLPHESGADAARVVIISDRLWRRVFNGDPSAIGGPLRLNDEAFTLVGVMPPDFYYPHREMEAWIPIRLGPDEFADRDNNYLNVVARLTRGTSIETARAEMSALAAALEREYPTENADTATTVLPLADQVSSQSRSLIWALASAALCLLLIACTNLASLLLARFSARRRELTVRAALGAGRERMVRQLLTESLALTTAGGALGILLAAVATPLLSRLVPTTLPVPEASVADARVLIFAAAVATATGLLFGVLPAVRAWRGTDASALREGPRGATHGRERLRAGLVTAQIAASVLLLVSAGLLVRALARVEATDPGFDARQVLTARTPLQGQAYVATAARTQFYDRVLEQVRALPGVRHAAFTSFAPFTWRGGVWTVEMRGAEAREANTRRALLRFVTPGYFETLRIPLRRGRDVAASDTADAQLVAVVSESFVRQHWPGQDPMGRTFTFAFLERTVVGVVGDVRLRGLERASEPQVYLPSRQVPDGGLPLYAPKDLVVRADGDPLALGPAVRQIVRGIDPNLPVSDVRPLTALVEADVAPRRTQAGVLGLFAAMSLLLAGVGLHGLLAFAVSQRRREIGVRMALGASRGSVMAMIVRESALLAAAGGLSGMALAYGAGRYFESLLAGVRPADPLTFAAAAALVAAVALSGSALPALRAIRVDPSTALRAE